MADGDPLRTPVHGDRLGRMFALAKRLTAILGHQFSRPELAVEALTHSSAAQGPTAGQASNERLEFLGDRVLGLVVANLLYDRFSGEAEGHLARRHAELVRKETLARVAADIGLGPLIRMARGEVETGGRDNPAILADSCEAVIAALYLDGGLDAAAAFIRRNWSGLIEEDLTPPKDAKTALQEWLQGRRLGLPVYREIGREGPPHAPVFRVEVAVAGGRTELADGPSKRAAEQEAAAALLARLEAEGG